MKKIGIVAHSAEGAGLCFLTVCRYAAEILGEHMHPEIVMSAIPMALSMPGWWNDRHDEVEPFLLRGIETVARAGADFFICPDNTAHIILEKCIHQAPIPGLHIADVTAHEARVRGYKKVGLLGTQWTMSGTIYPRTLQENGIECISPEPGVQKILNKIIFDQLCNGQFGEAATHPFLEATEALRSRGAEAVILGCTEIPLIMNDQNSPLPTLPTTQLLAQYAVIQAMSDSFFLTKNWLAPTRAQLAKNTAIGGDNDQL